VSVLGLAAFMNERMMLLTVCAEPAREESERTDQLPAMMSCARRVGRSEADEDALERGSN
jgi:hypothetical protein